MIQRLFTESIIRRSDWGVLDEMAYRTPQCTYTPSDWDQLQESDEYDDLLNMGWMEITKPGQRSQGNLAFAHPKFFLGGGIRVNFKGKIVEFLSRPDGREFQKTLVDEGLEGFGKKCADINDYKIKLGFIIKYTLNKIGVIEKSEVYSQKDYKQVFVDCILNPLPGMGPGTVLKKIGVYLPPNVMDVFIEMEEKGELDNNVIEAFVMTDSDRKNR